MRKNFRILMVTTELFPYVKIGGMADVVSELSSEMKKQGNDVRIVLPFYKDLSRKVPKFETILNSMCVNIGNMEYRCAVRCFETSEKIPVYLIENEDFFARDGYYYNEVMSDYTDNPLRFAFFSQAALQLNSNISFKADIIQSHDWQTALVPAFLSTNRKPSQNDLGYPASILTIHNIAYQGIYPRSQLPNIELERDTFGDDNNQINFLKEGICYADFLTTVSPTYARDITTFEFGSGLETYLAARETTIKGITNGINYSLWNPLTDKLLPANFSSRSISGKSLCKQSLQKIFNLDIDNRIPILGSIGRLVYQKGFSLIVERIEQILQNMNVQFVILGSGEDRFVSFFRELSTRYLGRVGTYIGYDESLAHLITAGSDFFLMPSIWEPCGLNQMYSQRYGTLPIVRATGGLEDTVEQYDESTGNGTGFKFVNPTGEAFYHTVDWAISTYNNRPKHMHLLIQSAMKKDFSWKKSVQEYLKVYRTALGIVNAENPTAGI